MFGVFQGGAASPGHGAPIDTGAPVHRVYTPRLFSQYKSEAQQFLFADELVDKAARHPRLNHITCLLPATAAWLSPSFNIYKSDTTGYFEGGLETI